MPFYRYKAISSEGALVKGIIQATDLDAAHTATDISGLHLIRIRQINAYFASLLNTILARQIKKSDLIEFANNLSVMIRAGIPLLPALSDMTDTTENRYFAKKIENIRNNIAFGSSFSEAVKMHEEVFPDIFIRLIAVGEETGNLEGNLRDIADHIQRREDLLSAVKRAMIYPVFAIVTALGAFLFWLVYVLPKVLGIFETMELDVPLLTKMLLVMSNFAQKHWPLLLLLPILFFILAKLMKRNDAGAFFIDKVKLRFPIVKLLLVNKILGIFSEQMRILLKAGLTIDTSFDLVSEIVENNVFKKALLKTKEEVLAGASISDGMRNQNIFSPMLLRMVHIGETSGKLEEQFSFLSEFYTKKLDDISQRLGKLIEPLIIIFLGMLFAVIIIGLLLPIYDLVSRLGAL